MINRIRITHLLILVSLLTALVVLKHIIGGGSRFQIKIVEKCTNGNPEPVGPCPSPGMLGQYDQSDMNTKNATALVFYGRRELVSILIRYLLRNLKINGGVLDKIIFAVRTDIKHDLDYLNELVKQHPAHIWRLDFLKNVSYCEIFKQVAIMNHDLIFKIDDDVVFIANGTFERMIDEYSHGKYMFLSANVINHPLLSYVHARLGNIKPFSEYDLVDSDTFKIKEHRLDVSEAVGAQYDAWGDWWKNSKCAMMAHKSFIYHATRNHIESYNFGRWDFHSKEYTRWSINFVLVRGKYVRDMDAWFPHFRGDDEYIISKELARCHGEHSYAVGSAVAAHFSYHTQHDYLVKRTNLLEQYKRLADSYLGSQRHTSQ